MRKIALWKNITLSIQRHLFAFMDGPYLYEILICFKKIEIKIHEKVDFVPTFTLPSYVAWLELFMKD